MKIKFLFLFFLFAIILKADSTYLSPSAYYTHGNYSNKAYSNAATFYNTLQLKQNLFLLNSYNNLKIINPQWDYKQQNFIAGINYYFFPYFLRLNYAHIKGDYMAKILFDEDYSDFTNVYNLDLYLYSDMNYAGAAFTFLNLTGFNTLQIYQLTLRYERIISNDWYFAIRPNYTSATDGRSMFSTSIRLHYALTPHIILKTGGFAGERAYYFDSDLLTVFNQYETQKHQYFFQADYFPVYNFGLIFLYQNTKFETYSINYFSIGTKINLLL
jgi:hypothetical protein